MGITECKTDSWRNGWCGDAILKRNSLSTNENTVSKSLQLLGEGDY